MIEPSDLSPNQQLYGNLHNLLHVAVSLVHDPDQRHLETFGVMGDSATAMRDPIFYRVHAMVNDIFTEHKNTLPRYTVPQVRNIFRIESTNIAIKEKSYKCLPLLKYCQEHTGTSRTFLKQSKRAFSIVLLKVMQTANQSSDAGCSVTHYLQINHLALLHNRFAQWETNLVFCTHIMHY